MESPIDSRATRANLEAFDATWTRGQQIKGRFQYNLESARKEFLSLLDDLSIPRSHQQVLDVGFGSGMLMFEFDAHSTIRGVELSKSALATAETRARRRGYRDYAFVAPTSAERLPYEDGVFSIVIASHVVEHVDDDIGFVREMLRVLSPAGWLIIIGPLDNTTAGPLSDAQLVNPAFAHGHYHVRNYNAETFIARIERAGGTVRRAVLSMETWDWKVQRDPWRARLASTAVGKVVNTAIAAAINVPLSLVPLGTLRVVDRFCAKRGYQPRQIALAAQKRSL